MNADGLYAGQSAGQFIHSLCKGFSQKIKYPERTFDIILIIRDAGRLQFQSVTRRHISHRDTENTEKRRRG
ncbi:MAG: hypothetical protein DRI57_00120 [Deltaproteobacteria bacterium]|nr:MAG: hypothetical protein DRI57_00120 [Deltaproteobacteria bacterium]